MNTVSTGAGEISLTWENNTFSFTDIIRVTLIPRLYSGFVLMDSLPMEGELWGAFPSQ